MSVFLFTFLHCKIASLHHWGSQRGFKLKDWATKGNLDVSFLNPGLGVAKGMCDMVLNECFYTLKISWLEGTLAASWWFFHVFCILKLTKARATAGPFQTRDQGVYKLSELEVFLICFHWNEHSSDNYSKGKHEDSCSNIA